MGCIVFVRVAVVAALVMAPGLCHANEANARAPDRSGCAALDEIVRAADGDFVSLKGPPKHEGLGMWHATVSIPGGSDCLVYAPPTRMYACNLYMGSDESDADAAYQDAAAMVRRCVPKGWTVRERANGLRTLTRASRDHGSPSISIVSSISDASAYLVDFWVGPVE